MNSAHVAATGGLTAALAQVIMWLGHWPLQAPTEPTATAIAGLAVAGIGFLFSRKKGVTQ